MLNTTIRARFTALQRKTSPIAVAPFVVLGVPTSEPLRILKISNNTDQDILISTDGVTPMDFIAANGFVLYDLGTNRASMGSTLQFAAGTQFWVVAATAPTTTGDVTLTGIYSGI
jgi:hypothetical protein